jgi:hypothetical protein
MKKGLIFAVMSFVLLACNSEQAIQIDEPWIREAPPNARASGGFMIIKNLSAQQQILNSVASSAFEKVEIHQTVAGEGGTMKMVPQPELVIEAKSQVVLKPGSYHLMLIGAKKPLKAGDEVNLTLKFANGDEIKLTAPIRQSSGMNHHN